VLLDRDEASRLVKATRWIVRDDAETYSWVSLSNAGLDEVGEEPSSDPLVPTGGDDCNGQFGHIVSDEAIAVACVCVRPVPSRAHRSVLFGNESIVALPWPSSEVQRVPGIGHHLLSGRCQLVRSPDCGLTKHRREKGEVLSSGRSTPNLVHPGESSSFAKRVSDKRRMYNASSHRGRVVVPCPQSTVPDRRLRDFAIATDRHFGNAFCARRGAEGRSAERQFCTCSASVELAQNSHEKRRSLRAERPVWNDDGRRRWRLAIGEAAWHAITRRVRVRSVPKAWTVTGDPVGP
jgi:hypothetical protein